MVKNTSIAIIITGVLTLFATLPTIIAAFFLTIPVRLLLDSSDALHSLSDRNIDGIHSVLGILLSALGAGMVIEYVWQHFMKSPNRRTQRIVFILLALAASIYWQYAIFY